MRTSTALILVLAALCCCASAARLDPVMLDETLAAGQGNLRASSRAWLNVMRMGELAKRRSSEKDMEEEEEGLHNRIFAIRFDVPPSQSKKFEDMWLKMDKDEKDANVFTLKSSSLDNIFYYSYGEFEKHRDLHDHLMSDHFNEFAEYVDKHGIHWSLELLNDLSYETERKAEKHKGLMLGRQQDKGQDSGEPDWDRYIPKDYRPYVPEGARPKHHKGRKNDLSVTALATLPNKGVDATDDQVLSLYNSLTRRKESAHILINYYVQPGMMDSFIDEWTKMAEKTLEEPGNHVYSLRKSATDNARVVAYGTWDSYRDYMDHIESKHLQKFVDWLDDHNLPFFIRPLETVE